jgi:Kelch motif protein
VNLFRLSLLAGGLWLGSWASAQPGAAPIQRLPSMNVSAHVPLVRVTDYRLVEPRFAAAAVTVGNFIYIIGGSNPHHPTLKSVERFDPRTGRSEIFAQLRIGRLWPRAVALGDKIYVLGGQSDGIAANAAAGINGDLASSSIQARNKMLDDATTTATTLALNVSDLESTTEIIDTVSGHVSRGPAMPEARLRFGCVALGQKIYMIGGAKRRADAVVFTNTVKVFDVATKHWSDGVPMPTPRDAVATVVNGGFIISPGGSNGQFETSDVAVFNPRNQTWSLLPQLVRPRSATALVFLGHYLFFFGDEEVPDEILAYDLATKTSEIFRLGYKPAQGAAAAIQGEKIYVFGGMENDRDYAHDYVQVYALAPTAPPRAGP